ncbi:hypothetical protein ATO6_10430 [Oceanicola sp. 22II-s10i]|uniref:iron chaperone n=1 Tax=Oceanicola sp. 22II-s10i TaxID=1317116 RepID=UPI000B526869|nr:DUF1801 domain-containing protein [Oceanicola sp. 22II-s10i]OWU84744.1 hypothetical protein ATO6_10430 [Oceanicola sp. 22II-s10i]
MTAPADHDAYLATLPPDRAACLNDLRRRIAAQVPDAVEVISYAMPGFRLPGGKVVMGYAAWKAHYAIYPHSGSTLAGVSDLPDGMTAQGGTLRVPWDLSVPDDLISRIVALRRAEIGS